MDLIFWAGTEASAHEHREQTRLILSDPRLADPQAFATSNDDSAALDVTAEGVAIIPISGSLTAHSSFWTWLAGGQSYDSIRSSLVAAADDSSIKHILLNIDSPGGSVAMLQDAADLISEVGKIKPVTAYTGGSMQSAAYFLGANAKKVVASQMAQVGSVGVMAVLREQSKAMEEAGVKAHVIKTGKFKALGNPYEPISEDDLKIIEARLQPLHEAFVDHVASARSIPRGTVSTKIANGMTFSAQEALDLKLIDGIGTLDSVVGQIRKSIKSKESTMAKKQTPVLSAAAQAAAVAEGAVLGDNVLDQPEATPPSSEASPPPTTSGEAPPAGPPTTATGEGDGAPSASSASAGFETGLETYLKGEVKTLTAEAAELKAKLATLEASHAQLAANESGLKSIVVASLNHLNLALGRSVDASFADLPAETLVKMHSNARKDFEDVFPVGGAAFSRNTAPPTSPSGDPKVHKIKPGDARLVRP